ncbi:HAD-IB family hydrolase [Helicobacter zhangjianzhongii]|uniref:HAD-IB family hydrolase n=1 Tax=Helicobacter zhangjianzhongii TaxID=2974574 RepID=A0ACC6FPF2_9HELI|nr:MULTISPECIES: HAD-IB family hydrolase [unclassified Helicobacter]MDL0079073.1 HAD-IB family hydrolase [Helicobacter sp. CPD2-1]MDL0081099.1 HAD-IB family hydrolase [Helicobacter sp. XJK30-2]
MKKILAIFDFCETIVDRQSISPFLELARKANSAYRSPSSYKQRLLRKGARIIYKALGSHSADLESSSRADEHLFPSSRADEVGVAIHKGAKADSSTKMDCHAAATAASRNDSKNSPCEKVDSSDTPIFASAKTMDCRALPSGKTRNDRNLSDSAKDSRIFESQAQNVFCSQAAGGRICDEKAGLCSGEQGDKTRGLSTPRATNSLLYRAKPTPKPKKLNLLHKALIIPTYPELAGLPLSTALSLAHSYALSLRTHINQKVLDRLLWHKAQGHTIVVVSGGLGIYIRPFMQQFGIDTILAVELESTFDKQGQEILSGNRSGLHTMQERKLYALDDRLDLARYDLPNSYAYSDCPSDVPLLSLVGKPCVVQGSQETRWARILGYPILVP